jgi:arginase family enzyme
MAPPAAAPSPTGLPTLEEVQRAVSVAAARTAADLRLRGAQVLDPFTGGLRPADVLLAGRLIAAVVPDGDVRTVQQALESVTREVHALDALPVFLGGDNSLTFANAAPLVEASGVGVVNFDAHLDCRTLADGPSSGTPYRQLFEDGLDGYAVVGARHFETSTSYHEYVRERGGTIVPAEDAGGEGDPAGLAVRQYVRPSSGCVAYLVYGGGGIHCITQQQPAAPPPESGAA